MTKLPAKELTERGRLGRNSKARGKRAERTLKKILADKYGLPVLRVLGSGALAKTTDPNEWAGLSDNCHGDLQLECGKDYITIESKTRATIPKYCKAGTFIEGFCKFYSLEDFVTMLKDGDEQFSFERNKTKRWVTLKKWFDQDNSSIVAMRRTGHSTWVFAVRLDEIERVSGQYATVDVQ